MGYYTRYSLEVKQASNDYDFQMLEFGTDEDFIASRIGYNPFSDETKWYDHDEDMKKISKEFPSVLFILSGEGEESGDIWTTYYKGGKCQYKKARIIIDPFDETKLQ